MDDFVAGCVSFILIVALVAGAAFGIPRYKVWQGQYSGKAKLIEANQTKQIQVTEAKAKKESATYEAQAEIERAKGVAQANQIIGSSLKGNHEYLMYLYIQTMENTQNQVIYVPTEGSLPILEAGRFSRSIK